MAVTMFLSMWMQNLTVVAMMCPICLTILEQLEIVSENLQNHFRESIFETYMTTARNKCSVQTKNDRKS